MIRKFFRCWSGWAGIGVGVALIFLSGCGKNPESPGKPSEATRTVRVVTVAPVPIWDEEEVVGGVQAAQRAVLSAKVTGVVDTIRVTPGTRVTHGDPLVTIDAREIRARLDQAVAAQEQAQKDFARSQRLLQSGSATRQEFDAATARLRTADAGLVEAKTMLGYTEIPAPFDGVVTRKLAEVGDLASPGKPLLEVENSSLLRFEAEVPEALIGRVAMQSRVPVQVGAAHAHLQGVVSEIAPSASAASRTYLVKLDLPAAEGLRAGQFGRARIPVKERPAVLVPETAVVRRGQLEMVFVVEGGRARLRLVKTGRVFDGGVEILSGLSGGEAVVVEDASQLRDGAHVEGMK